MTTADDVLQGGAEMLKRTVPALTSASSNCSGTLTGEQDVNHDSSDQYSVTKHDEKETATGGSKFPTIRSRPRQPFKPQHIPSATVRPSDQQITASDQDEVSTDQSRMQSTGSAMRDSAPGGDVSPTREPAPRAHSRDNRPRRASRTSSSQKSSGITPQSAFERFQEPPTRKKARYESPPGSGPKIIEQHRHDRKHKSGAQAAYPQDDQNEEGAGKGSTYANDLEPQSVLSQGQQDIDEGADEHDHPVPHSCDTENDGMSTESQERRGVYESSPTLQPGDHTGYNHTDVSREYSDGDAVEHDVEGGDDIGPATNVLGVHSLSYDAQLQSDAQEEQELSLKEAYELIPVKARFRGDLAHVQQARLLEAAHQDTFEARDKWQNCALEEWQRGGQELAQRFSDIMTRVVKLMADKTRRSEELQKRISDHKASLDGQGAKLKDTKGSLENWGSFMMGHKDK